MPVSAGMKRISEDRQDAAVHRLEEEQEHEEQARQQKEEQEEARQQKEEVCQRVEEVRQQKEEQEGKQAPKARGKNKTFDERMEDLKRYNETHGNANVFIQEDKSLYQFCADTSVRDYHAPPRLPRALGEQTSVLPQKLPHTQYLRTNFCSSPKCSPIHNTSAKAGTKHEQSRACYRQNDTFEKETQ